MMPRAPIRHPFPVAKNDLYTAPPVPPSPTLPLAPAPASATSPAASATPSKFSVHRLTADLLEHVQNAYHKVCLAGRHLELRTKPAFRAFLKRTYASFEHGAQVITAEMHKKVIEYFESIHDLFFEGLEDLKKDFAAFKQEVLVTDHDVDDLMSAAEDGLVA